MNSKNLRQNIIERRAQFDDPSKKVFKSFTAPPSHGGLHILKALISFTPESKAIVAVNTADMVKNLTKKLHDEFSVVWMHRVLSLNDKTAPVEAFFGNESYRVLLKT